MADGYERLIHTKKRLFVDLSPQRKPLANEAAH